MKKLIFSLFTISLLFTFAACGSDDEKEEKFFTGDCEQTILLKSGAAGSTIIISATSTLDDMLEDSSGYGTPISSGELLIAGSNTSVTITGLPEGTVLKNFKLNINGIEQSFGEISVAKANLNLYTSTYFDYFQKAFNQMVADKKLDVEVTFAPTVETDNSVKLEIVFSGRFSYWVKI